MIVARLLGVAEFALGSTMVFRAESLRAIGGFEAVQDYIADDYQLGKQISEKLNLRIEFAPVVVETHLGASRGARYGGISCGGRAQSVSRGAPGTTATRSPTRQSGRSRRSPLDNGGPALRHCVSA